MDKRAGFRRLLALLGGLYWAMHSLPLAAADLYLTPDPGFGVRGKIADLRAGDDATNSIIDLYAASSGAIYGLLNSESAPPASQIRQSIVRMRSDGTVDSSFGRNGYLTIGPLRWIDPGSNTSLQYLPSALTVDETNQQIYVAGISAVFGEPTALVQRVSFDGARDPSFGIAGGAGIGIQGTTVIRAGAVNIIRSLLLQPDGHLLVGFEESALYGQLPNIFVARLTPAGLADRTFGERFLLHRLGVIKLTGGHDAVVNHLALDADGRILLTGALNPNALGVTRGLLARLTRDGRLDTDFGLTRSGLVMYAPPDHKNIALDFARSKADGTIVVQGGHVTPQETRYFLAELTDDGIPLLSFGDNGTQDLGSFSGFTNVGAVAQADGRVLLYGATIRNSDLEVLSAGTVERLQGSSELGPAGGTASAPDAPAGTDNGGGGGSSAPLMLIVLGMLAVLAVRRRPAQFC